MTMTELQPGVSYNIILRYFKQKQHLPQFASWKPCYIFVKRSYVCRNGLAYHVSVCLYYSKVLYFIGMRPKHEPGSES